MNMFARFNENPAMTLQDIKETKRYGRTDARTDGHTDARTDGQRENSIPPTNKVCGGYNKAWYFMRIVCWQTILMKYHSLFLSKIRNDVAKFAVCCSCDWRIKG